MTTALPSESTLTGSTNNKENTRLAFVDLRAYLEGLLGTAGTQAAALTTLGAVLNGVLSNAANYTAVAADRGKLIDYTAAPYTLTLPTVATAGAGFVLAIRNSAASGNLTVGRNAANIDGVAADLTVSPGESMLVVCDGTGWYTVGRVVPPTFGVLLGVYARTTAGSGLTATRPEGATKALVCVQGGGGGGNSYFSNVYSGGGGGYAEALKSVSGNLTVTVGAGGAGGTTGGSGGASSVTNGSWTVQGNGGGGATSGAHGSGGGTSGGDWGVSGGVGSGSISGESFYYDYEGGPTWMSKGGTSKIGFGYGGSASNAGKNGAVLIYWYK